MHDVLSALQHMHDKVRGVQQPRALDIVCVAQGREREEAGACVHAVVLSGLVAVDSMCWRSATRALLWYAKNPCGPRHPVLPPARPLTPPPLPAAARRGAARGRAARRASCTAT